MDIETLSGVLHTALKTYTDAVRSTGRTTRLVEDIQPGDFIVCHVEREARRIEALAHRDRTKCRVVVAQPNLDSLFERLRGARPKRVVFEHTWLEAYYHECIERAHQDLRGAVGILQRPDAPPPETPRVI